MYYLNLYHCANFIALHNSKTTIDNTNFPQNKSFPRKFHGTKEHKFFKSLSLYWVQNPSFEARVFYHATDLETKS